jgi:hypothetical protein
MQNESMTKALAEYASTAGTPAPGKRASTFAEMIVEELVQPNRLSLDFFSGLMPTRRLGPGDTLVKRVQNRGVPVRTMVPGTEHLASQMVPPSQVMSFGIDYLIAKVRYNLWEVQRGEVATVGQLRNELRDSIIDTLVSRVFTLLGTVWSPTNTPSNYLTVTGKVNELALETMIENVLLQAGTIRGIMGTRRALFPMYKFAGIVEHVVSGGTAPTNTQVVGIQRVLDEWSRTNRLSSFRGIPVIELPQVFERSATNWNKPLIPDNLILVIGDQPGEIVLYGDFAYQEGINTNVEPPDYTLASYIGWGMIIDYPERIGVIKIV